MFRDDNADEKQLVKSLQYLWLDRENQPGMIRSLLCLFGAHLWLAPDYTTSRSKRDVRFCPWCASVQIDGRVYHS